MKMNVIITAGGLSERYGERNKLFEPCGTSRVIVEAIKPFLSFDEVTRVIIGCASDQMDELLSILDFYGLEDDRRVTLAIGGATRTQTVRNALCSIENDADYIAVHDGARPYVTPTLIAKVLSAAQSADAALPLVKLTDSLVNVADLSPVDREGLRGVQTPFIAKASVLKKAYQNAETAFYDDISVIKTLDNVKIAYVDGDIRNKKITYSCDLDAPLYGVGYDIHRLESGQGLKLCGVLIPCAHSFVAHSDGDVPVHALMDATLAAIGEKDIGHLYPVDDSRYDDADSMELLRGVLSIAASKKYRPVGATVEIIAEKPRLSQFIDEMRRSLSAALGVPIERIGISATTNEGVGVLGEPYAAIAAFASVSLSRF